MNIIYDKFDESIINNISNIYSKNKFNTNFDTIDELKKEIDYWFEFLITDLNIDTDIENDIYKHIVYLKDEYNTRKIFKNIYYFDNYYKKKPCLRKRNYTNIDYNIIYKIKNTPSYLYNY